MPPYSESGLTPAVSGRRPDETFQGQQEPQTGGGPEHGIVRFLLSLLHALRNNQTEYLVVYGAPRALSEAGLRSSPEGTTVRRSAFQVSRVTAMEQSETPLTSTR